MLFLFLSPPRFSPPPNPPSSMLLYYNGAMEKKSHGSAGTVLDFLTDLESV